MVVVVLSQTIDNNKRSISFELSGIYNPPARRVAIDDTGVSWGFAALRGSVQSITCTSHMEKQSKQVVLPSKQNESLLFLTLRQPKHSSYWLTTVFTKETITNDL